MSSDTSDRQKRLAEQMRANLRRRKEQARVRAGAGGASPEVTPAKAPAEQD